ncbi:pyridoxal 5'-phosphate synthase glutaminase subunit PdxT [Metallumcola ferriviriculae]|uniref:Pyridoxal 5'-phosphate synthase subunit PdxT n=1 Tax=Metallumcola ferriviriculae TaxID=3039180 RepID=A0AAU0UJW5_9FIRM|nr:pyridoxal 5'-phosphate synthase glutaminase subunit PdxT [Desulfitibacteraceae bacterium MK1]
MRIGVLAMQGAFREHKWAIERLGEEAVEVRLPHHLKDVDGIIIPGGESTTIGKLLNRYKLMEPIKELAAKGIPIMGTCAGMILLAKDIIGSEQPRLGFMDISVVRNGFGRQVESFEVDLDINAIGRVPFHAVFIRAPYVKNMEPQVGILAQVEEKVVMARQGNFLACAFHPELTEDDRVHSYFLKMVKENL